MESKVSHHDITWMYSVQ